MYNEYYQFYVCYRQTSWLRG